MVPRTRMAMLVFIMAFVMLFFGFVIGCEAKH